MAKAVSIDVAPVPDALAVEPGEPFEGAAAEAGTEDHQGVRDVGEREVAGLVLDDEHGPDGYVQMGELVGP